MYIDNISLVFLAENAVFSKWYAHASMLTEAQALDAFKIKSKE